MLRTLQVFRGLAALSVAAFHLSILLGDPRYGGEEVFRDFTARGNLGVDFFFVLSGFIILAAHHGDLGKPAELRTYLKRRFIRIYPIYWLYTAVFCALLLLGLGSVAKPPATLGEWLTTLSLVRFDETRTPIGPAWTLFHEIAFYAVFATLIVNLRLGLLVMSVWLGAILLVFQDLTNDPTPFLTYLGKHNLYFFYGMAAFLASRHVASAKTGYAFSVLSVALIWLGYQLDVTGHGAFSVPVYGLGFSALIIGAVAVERAAAVGLHPALTFFGDASYTIYLTHVAFQGLFTKIALKVGLLDGTRELAYLAILAASVAAGGILYYLLERPLLAWMKRSHTRRSRSPAPSPATPS